MEKLLADTTAYQTVQRDVNLGKPSHAYLIQMGDSSCLRTVLKRLAMTLYGYGEDSREGSLILREGFVDCKTYPEQGKKYAVDDVTTLIEDTNLLPVEGAFKVYILDNFQDASLLVQNKLLKTLEEPPKNVIFLLGATTLAPLLDTVKSRVKTLVIPPFTDEQIRQALIRKYGQSELIQDALAGCGGILGDAYAIMEEGWYQEVKTQAISLCSAKDIAVASEVAIACGESKYKVQLLTQVQTLYHSALKAKVAGTADKTVQKIASLWHTETLLFALEQLEQCAVQLKFNAWFQGLVFDFCVSVIQKENHLWSKS